jgi:Ferredoxin
MTQIRYAGNSYAVRAGESVLDTFLRLGVEFPFSCRKGTCHGCLCRVTAGVIPAEAQRGLDAERCAQGYALACRLRPAGDMEIVSGKAPAAAPACPAARRSPPVTLPDAEMWQALQQGVLLNTLLEDFYTRVYADARLAPFFHGVTKQRAIEKQFLFLRQLFTGEKVYFGDRPRNAHHWMVISDELFDYREHLMESCLRAHGLPEYLITRWLAMEEGFRADLVKAEPRKRVMGGMELPVDGFGETVMEVGTLCDSCGGEIDAGTPVRYHLRLGTTYCPGCALSA